MLTGAQASRVGGVRASITAPYSLRLLPLYVFSLLKTVQYLIKLKILIWYIICSISLFLKSILLNFRICFVGVLRDRMRGTYRLTSVSTAWRFVARGLRATCCCECIPRSISSISSIRSLTRCLFKLNIDFECTILIFSLITGRGHSAGRLVLAVAVQLAKLSDRRTRVWVATAGAPVREPPVVVLTRSTRCGRLACARCRQSPQGAARTANLWRCTVSHTGAIRANGELFVNWFTIAGHCLLWCTVLWTFLYHQGWFACARKLGIKFPASFYPVASSTSAVWRNVCND